MFELTNDQRKYFAIPPVEDSWEKVEVTPSPYDRYYTYAYRIVTENPNLTPADLEGIKMLPSQMIMDNVFYYGECPIIGNAPISPDENNYPIHFGNTISAWERGVRYQCGRTYIAIDEIDDPYKGFYRNGGIGWTFDVNLPILNACIAKNSNDPYWEMRPKAATRQDLRSPENAEVLNAVQAIVGLNQQP